MVRNILSVPFVTQYQLGFMSPEIALLDPYIRKNKFWKVGRERGLGLIIRGSVNVVFGLSYKWSD